METLPTMLKMYTSRTCSDCRRAKNFLAERGIGVEEIYVETTPGAAEWVIARNQGKRKLPTFELDGHAFACSPFDPNVMKRELGLN